MAEITNADVANSVLAIASGQPHPAFGASVEWAGVAQTVYCDVLSMSRDPVAAHAALSDVITALLAAQLAVVGPHASAALVSAVVDEARGRARTLRATAAAEARQTRGTRH